jgi:hypothetical protein
MPLEAHLAGLPEHGSAVVVDVVAEHDAEPATAQQPRQTLLAVAKRQSAQVLAVKLQEVGAAKLKADKATRVDSEFVTRRATVLPLPIHRGTRLAANSKFRRNVR